MVAAESKKRDTQTSVSFFGAATQIRTGDLILTKDALYLLSYSSKVHAPIFGACLATAKGLEPSTSGVTGRRSNRLNHAATLNSLVIITEDLRFVNRFLEKSQKIFSGPVQADAV